MCVVSMVGDHYGRRIPAQYPWAVPPATPTPAPFTSPTRAEFDALKREVESMKELLKSAKQYDADNNEPDCELDDKVTFLRRVAEAVGVDLDDVFGPQATVS